MELIPTVFFTYVLVIYNILWTRIIGVLSTLSLTLTCHSKLVQIIYNVQPILLLSHTQCGSADNDEIEDILQIKGQIMFQENHFNLYKL